MPKADCDNKNSHKFKFHEGIYNNYTMLNAARVLIYKIHTAHSHSTKCYRTSFRSATGRKLEEEGCRRSSVRSLSEKPIK
jgi:hypothetical protein